MKDFIKSADEEALKSLKDITFSTSNDVTKPFDFSVTFTFGPNDFFENTVLTKHYHMKEEKEC